MSTCRLLLAVALFGSAAYACPASTTSSTSTTPCPTASSTACVTGQSCAATACTASQTCFNNNQYSLCQVTTQGTGAGVSQTVKFCSNLAGDACNSMFLSGIQAPTPNTFNTFALCCAATGTNVYYDTYDPPGAPVNNLYCMGLTDAAAYKVCLVSAGSSSNTGKCVRFPAGCTTANLFQYIGANSATAAWTATTFTSFSACCAGAPAAVAQSYGVNTGVLLAASGTTPATNVDICGN